MNPNYNETELQILEAARKVFLQYGFDGATTQMIATESGINKALLHYYFRSKDRLFEAVFMEAFTRMIPNLLKIFTAEIDFFEKIRAFVGAYIDALLQYPQIPLFVLHELKRNPDRIVQLIKSSGIRPEFILEMFRGEVGKGNIAPIDPYHLLVNMLSLCIFPFAAKPMIQGFIFHNDEAAFQEFLVSRKEQVAEFIIKAIKPC
ncbi:MAG: TetR/AcrR family transcriptional regulator [Bacteroidales bacterium]|nr:TetR/AcrR family transcriptional regulator [Bacteroidales bacterium]